MLRSIGTTEWLVIGGIVLLLFGGKKIPELFKGLGDAVREFRKAAKDTGKEQKAKKT